MHELQDQMRALRLDVGERRDQSLDATMRTMSDRMDRLRDHMRDQQNRTSQGTSKQGISLRDFQLGDDILDYVEHAISVKACNGWTDERAKFGVKASLKGDAAKMASDIIPNVMDSFGFPESFEVFMRKIRDRFLPESESEVAMMEFVFAKQGPMELTQVFHARVRALFLRAYHRDSLGQVGYTFTLAEENNMISTFKRGLRNPAVQDAVQRRKPKSYAEALEAALDEIAVIKMRRYQTTRAQPQNNGRPFSRPGQVSSMQPPSRGYPVKPRTTPMENRKCYTCNSQQHMERQCPGRRKWFRIFNKSDSDYENWVKQKRVSPVKGPMVAAVEGEEECEEAEENEEHEAVEMGEEEMVEEMDEYDPDAEDPDFQ